MPLRIGSSGPAIAACLALLSVAGCGSPETRGHAIYGYVDARGRPVIPPRFLLVRPFHEGLAAAQVAEGWGFIDREGRWMIEPAFSDAGNFSEGLAAVRDADAGWGFVDRNGDWIVPPGFDAACPFLSGHAYVAIHAGSVAAILDHEGRVSPPGGDPSVPYPLCLAMANNAVPEMMFDTDESDGPGQLESGLLPAAAIRDGDATMGFADLAGHWVIAPEYDWAGHFADGLARVEKDGKSGFIDRTGRLVVPLRYPETLERFSRDRTIALAEDRAWLIDSSGNVVADLGPWTGKLGEEIAQFLGFSDFFADGLLPWRADDQWGYIDLEGKWAIEPRYDFAQPFHGGQASVVRDGKGLLIDRKGKEIAGTSLDWIGPSDGTLVRTGTLTRWGFLDASASGTTPLPYFGKRLEYDGVIFTRTRPLHFSEGLAIVSRIAPHRWAVLDAKGRKLVDTQAEWVEAAGPGLFRYASDQRWGLLDDRLRPITEPVFDGKLNPAFTTHSSTAQASIGGKLVCIDRKGRVSALADGLGPPCQPRAVYDLSPDGRGIHSVDGAWSIPAIYDHISELSSSSASDRYFWLLKGDTLRVARITGPRVSYSDPVERDSCDSVELCLVRVDGQLRRLDPSTLSPAGPVFDESKRGPGDGLAVRRGEAWGFMRADGALVVEPQFQAVRATQDAVLVQRENRWGAVDLDGKAVLSIRYDGLVAVKGGGWAARLGDKWGIVGDGDITYVEPQFDAVVSVEDVVLTEAGLIAVMQGDRPALVTGNGRRVEGPAPDWLDPGFRLLDFSTAAWAIETSDASLYFVDKETLAVHQLAAPDGYSWGDLRFFRNHMEIRRAGRLEPRYVLVDDAGHYLVDMLFDSVSLAPFEDGDARRSRFLEVALAGKCGFLDASDGRWIIPLQYDHCSFGDEGRFLVGVEDY